MLKEPEKKEEEKKEYLHKKQSLRDLVYGYLLLNYEMEMKMLKMQMMKGK